MLIDNACAHEVGIALSRSQQGKLRTGDYLRSFQYWQNMNY